MSITPNGLENINSILQGMQPTQGGSFDLSDNTFSNMLNDKLNSLTQGAQEIFTSMMGPLGIPAGINIEGLTDSSPVVEVVNPSEFSEISVDQSEITGNDENLLKSGGIKVEQNLFNRFETDSNTSSLVRDLFQISNSHNPITQTQSQDNNSNGFNDFLRKQASSLYGTMGRTMANSLNDLLSAL